MGVRRARWARPPVLARRRQSVAARRRSGDARRRACRADGRRRLPAAVPRGGCAMTATEGAPALDGAGTGAGPGTAGAKPAPQRDDGGAGATPGPRAPAAAARAPRLRTVLSLARVEASLLVRSRLVLAGLLAGG